MKKLVLVLAILLAFFAGFALNGVIQNCKTSCERGGHASCEKNCEKGCEKHGGKSCDRQGMGGDACCKKGATDSTGVADCCAKTAAGDEQECCKKNAAGDLQECCAKHEGVKPAAANEIAVQGEEKACCKKGAHDKK